MLNDISHELPKESLTPSKVGFAGMVDSTDLHTAVFLFRIQERILQLGNISSQLHKRTYHFHDACWIWKNEVWQMHQEGTESWHRKNVWNWLLWWYYQVRGQPTVVWQTFTALHVVNSLHVPMLCSHKLDQYQSLVLIMFHWLSLLSFIGTPMHQYNVWM